MTGNNTIAEDQYEEILKIRIELENLTQAVYELKEALVEGIKFLKIND
jgi:hypothetical protein